LHLPENVMAVATAFLALSLAAAAPTCPAIADLDLGAIARRTISDERRARIRTLLASAEIPAGAPSRPSPNASIVVRVRVPAGGLYPADDSAVVWREADGSWWFWRRTTGGPSAPPPPPAPPGAVPDPNPAPYDPYPPTAGRLGPHQAARMEAAYRDPCRTREPAIMPAEAPLARPVDGSRTRLCPPDSAATFGEIVERGREPQLIVVPCINQTATFTLLNVATYASAEDEY
jgi:hypothetical protein